MSVPRSWRSIPQRYRFEASKCKKCGEIHYPPRRVCRACHSRDFEKFILADEGKIISFTVIRTPPAQFKDLAPFPVAIIENDDGVRMTLQIADSDGSDLEIGKRVKFEFRRLQEEGGSGVITYGHKAVLI